MQSHTHTSACLSSYIHLGLSQGLNRSRREAVSFFLKRELCGGERKGSEMEKKESFLSKYVTFCGKVYDFFGMCWHGQRKHTLETLKISQKRGTWIVSLFLVLAVIGAFTDDEEENMAEVAEDVEVAESSVSAEEPTKTESKATSSSWSYKPTMSVYVCSKCATSVIGSSQPRSTKCPNSSGMHQWDNIGLKGDTTYQCGKCGVTISAQPTPKPGRCPRALGHKWERL